MMFDLMRLSYHREHRLEPLQLGVSFSAKYARELGVDPVQTLQALTGDLGIKKIRLMSYWDDLEPEPGQYRFDELDWQFRMAEQNHAKVSLAIGMRQPRFPECHAPGWVGKLPPAERIEALDRFLEGVVERYRSSSALESYQLENEVSNRSFGRCPPFDRARLTAEYQLVKRLDPTRPVIINVGNQSGLPIRGPRGDKIGLSVYRVAYNGSFGPIPIPTSSWWHGGRAWIIQHILKRPVFIHELQAEPWGPKATRDLSLAEQNRTMNAVKLKDNVDLARRTGVREIYLWGGEWWYWRLVKFNDPTVWESARQIYSQS